MTTANMAIGYFKVTESLSSNLTDLSVYDLRTGKTVILDDITLAVYEFVLDELHNNQSIDCLDTLEAKIRAFANG